MANHSSTKQTCEALGVSRVTLQRYITLGCPVAVKSDKGNLFNIPEVVRWRDSNISQKTDDSQQDASDSTLPDKGTSEAKKVFWQAELSKLKFQREAKELISIQFAIDTIRPVLLNVVAKVRESSPKIASFATGSDDYETLDAEISKLLDNALQESLVLNRNLINKLKAETINEQDDSE